jgi:DNA-binding SARP family transcriptional activator
MATNGLKRLAGTYFVARPSLSMPSWPTVEQMGRARLAALAASADFLSLDKLAAVLRERYAEVLWIRLQTADSDPGGLLVTLLGAVARLDAEASADITGTATRRARMGDWRKAYQLLLRWLATAAARPAVLVLEGAEYLEAGRPAALDLLLSACTPSSADLPDVLLIVFKEWDVRRLRPHGQVLGPSRLRLDRCSAALLAEASLPGLTGATLDRAFALTHGAAGALQIAVSAGAVLGPEAFCAAAAGAADPQELLNVLGRHLLDRANEHTLAALAIASLVDVWHPAMAAALGHTAIDQHQPWWLDLTQGWRQLIPAWRTLVRSTGGTAPLDAASLRLLADHLVTQGSGDRAVDLYMEAREIGRAADTAASVAHDLARTGGWATLARLGKVLARDWSPAWHIPEPDDCTRRPTPWWGHRLVRRGRRSPAGAGNVRGTQPPESTADTGIVPTSRVRADKAPPAGLYEHGSEPHLTSDATAVMVTRGLSEITAHLLGELRVAFRDRPVETWVSGRGRAVFEYLLINRRSKVRRDRLMSVFWPDATERAARNSLHVAIHGLRQSLRTVAGDTEVIIHRDHAYFIEPSLDIWVDVEVFEERLKSAHQHLACAELEQAQAHFDAAICLYQGELLADDPYDEWAIVTREHLRLTYLDALDRLGMLRMKSDDYAGCIALCLKLLAYDNCREDTHCRLMRCYSRQGQVQLALRQYHSCAAALRRELGVAPAPTTTALFDRIRRREVI